MPFSGPGHKLGAGVPRELLALLGPEVFAADVWLDTSTDDSTLREAEALAATAWGAERSFFLLNGSSAGNHAVLLGDAAPGDEVVVARDLHKSLLAALILTGARPIYVAPRLHPELQRRPRRRPRRCRRRPRRPPSGQARRPRHPSYCGVASDLRGIAAVAHARGVPVYVDEAWDPFRLPPDLPPSAMASRGRRRRRQHPQGARQPHPGGRPPRPGGRVDRAGWRRRSAWSRRPARGDDPRLDRRLPPPAGPAR